MRFFWLVIVPLAALTACGGDDSPTTGTPPPPVKDGTTPPKGGGGTPPADDPEVGQADAAAWNAGKRGVIEGVVKTSVLRLVPGVVYIEKVEGIELKAPAKTPVMDQANKAFVPHVLPVMEGSTIDFPNSDTVRHNVYSNDDLAKPFGKDGTAIPMNLGEYPEGETKQVEARNAGLAPLRCNVHAEMSAFIIVTQNPWFAVPDKKGEFRIEGVPPGRFRLIFWHEKLAPASTIVEVRADQTTKVEIGGLERR